MRKGHFYKCGSLNPWRSNPHEMGHPTGLPALVKHQAFPWLTWGANPLSLDLSPPSWLPIHLSSRGAVILLGCKSNLDSLRKDINCHWGIFLHVHSVSGYCHLCFRWKSLYPGHVLAVLGLACVPAPVSKQWHYAIKRESVPSPLA